MAALAQIKFVESLIMVSVMVVMFNASLLPEGELKRKHQPSDDIEVSTPPHIHGKSDVAEFVSLNQSRSSNYPND